MRSQARAVSLMRPSPCGCEYWNGALLSLVYLLWDSRHHHYTPLTKDTNWLLPPYQAGGVSLHLASLCVLLPCFRVTWDEPPAHPQLCLLPPKLSSACKSGSVEEPRTFSSLEPDTEDSPSGTLPGPDIMPQSSAAFCESVFLIY